MGSLAAKFRCSSSRDLGVVDEQSKRDRPGGGASRRSDAAGRDRDGVLPPAAATQSLQAADELQRAGAPPVLHGDPMPPVAAIREALRLLSPLPAETFQTDAVLNCVDHAQRARRDPLIHEHIPRRSGQRSQAPPS